MGGVTNYRLVFGLSADPVHSGHVEMVVQSTLRLAERGFGIVDVLLVPVYRRNPVGSAKERLPASYRHRLAMCRLAAQEIAERLAAPQAYVRASALEAALAQNRRQPNYTAETLALLKLRSKPGTGLIFLISSELVAGPNPQLARWYRPELILRLAILAICPRPGYGVNQRFVAAIKEAGAGVVVLPQVVTSDVASTDVRRLLKAGHSPLALARRGWLTPSVARFLQTHNPYLL